jgi:DHA2 family multidrug resistance protein
MLLTVRAPARAQIHPRVSIEVARAALRPRIGLLVVAMLCILADQTATIGFGSVTPYVRGLLAADIDSGAWLTIAGGAAYVAGVVATVRLVERFGRRATLLTAAGAFALFTAISGLTDDYTTFLIAHTAAQFFQGISYVVGVVVMCAIFPRKFFAYTFILLSVASLSGQNLSPLFAGIAVDRATCTEFFAGTAVIIAVATILAAFVAPTDEPERKALPFDGVALGVVAATLLGVEYLVVQGERYAWFDAPHIPFVVLATLIGGVFVAAHLRFSKHPLVDWRSLCVPTHVIGDVLVAANGSFVYGSTVLLAFAQTTLGFTPTLAGELLALRLVVLVAVAAATGVASAKRLIDARISLGAALLIIAIAFWRISLETTTGSDLPSLVLDSLLLSVGLAVLTQTAPGLVFGPIPDEQIASATIFFKLFTLGGTLAATAIGTTFFDHRVAVWQAELAGAVTRSAPAVEALGPHAKLSSLAGIVARQAANAAYADEMRLFVVVALAVLPVLALVRPAFRAKISLGWPR